MIYFFTWNNEFLVSEAVKTWKKKFVEKFWDFNMIHIKDIESVDKNFLVENLTSTSFLSEKKLIILNIDKDISSDKEEFLIKILENIPEENILLINSTNIDKRSKLYKKIKLLSEIKEYNTQNDSDLYSIISKKYSWKIDNQAINTIIRYKAWNLNKIISEIEKLLITKDFINQKDIVENIAPELEESIFQVIDDILNKNTIEAIKKIENILNDTNIYAFYNNLLANLRTSVFIMKMKNSWKNQNDISSTLNLWNRTFLINKNYKISYSQAEKLYIWLINIDKKMKSWKLIWSEDNDLKFEIEKILIK